MPAKRVLEVAQRLQDLEAAETNRLLESTLRPLAKAGEAPSTSESVTVPVELLLTRFKNLDRAVTTLNQKLQDRDDALRRKAALDWFRVATAIALTWAATAGFPRLFGDSHAPTASLPETASAR